MLCLLIKQPEPIAQKVTLEIRHKIKRNLTCSIDQNQAFQTYVRFFFFFFFFKSNIVFCNRAQGSYFSSIQWIQLNGQIIIIILPKINQNCNKIHLKHYSCYVINLETCHIIWGWIYYKWPRAKNMAIKQNILLLVSYRKATKASNLLFPWYTWMNYCHQAFYRDDTN